MTNCPICLEPLSSKTFGNTAPCGHYFHEECYNAWVASKRTRLVNGEYFTKCPTCNTPCTSFIRSYLDLDKMAIDDVSISSDDGDTSCEEDNDDAFNSGTKSDDDADRSLSGSTNALQRNGSASSSTRASDRSHPEEIIMLDDSDDEQEHVENSIARAENPSRPSFAVGKRNNPKPPKARGRSSGSGSGSGSDDKLIRKYKLLKRKLSAMKESVLQQQQMNQAHQKLKGENDALLKNNEELTANIEINFRDNLKNMRELADFRNSAARYERENDGLKKRLCADSRKHTSEKESLREQVENAKASSMEEMKEIAVQKKSISKQYTDLLTAWKEKEDENRELDKENAKLKRLLTQYASEEVDQLAKARESAKPMSRSDKLNMVKFARREIDEARVSEEEKAKSLRRKIERKNMLKNRPSMQRVVSMTNKLKKRKNRPAFLNSAPIAPDRKQAASSSKVSKPMKKHGTGIASNDLRNIFSKRK